MERRLQKDFQIGIVEGIVNAVIQSEKEPKDVFSQIAKAIGRKSSGSKKKDWNAMVRKNTLAKDPIGSTTEATMKQTRRSIRRHLQTQNSDLASLDPNRLVDYNPNLLEVSPTTRIAYAKFMIGRARPIPEQKEEGGKCISFSILMSTLLLLFIEIIFRVIKLKLPKFYKLNLDTAPSCREAIHVL